MGGMLAGLVRMGIGRMMGITGRGETEDKAAEAAKKGNDVVRNLFGEDDSAAESNLFTKNKKKNPFDDIFRTTDKEKLSSRNEPRENEGQEQHPSASSNDYQTQRNDTDENQITENPSVADQGSANKPDTSQKSFANKKKFLKSLNDYTMYSSFAQQRGEGAQKVGADLGNAIEGTLKGGEKQPLSEISSNSDENSNDSGNGMFLPGGRGDRASKTLAGDAQIAETTMKRQISGATDRIRNTFREPRNENNEPEGLSFRTDIQTGAWATFQKSINHGIRDWQMMDIRI